MPIEGVIVPGAGPSPAPFPEHEMVVPRRLATWILGGLGAIALLGLVTATFGAPAAGLTASPTSGRITVSAPPTAQTITHSRPLVDYQVSFVGTGLPAGTGFTVTLNGTTATSRWFGHGIYAVAFAEPNGSYPYTVTSPSGWSANHTSGTLTVNGANTGIWLGFSPSGPGGSDHAAWGGIPFWVWAGVAVAVVAAAVIAVLAMRRRRAPPPAAAIAPPSPSESPPTAGPPPGAS